MLRTLLFSLVTLSPTLAHADVWRFTWNGGGGYQINGAFSFPAGEVKKRLVFGSDLTCFEIFGTHNDQPIGAWGLHQWTVETQWRFHFDPTNGRVLVEEDHGVRMPQAWNMGGGGEDCGEGGFGFNIGNAAQDICIDNQLIWESQVSPFQPIQATPAPDYQFSEIGCVGDLLLSGL